MRRTLPFFLIYFALALNTAWAKSATNDEAVHILRAYALTSRGDLQFQQEHPPLSHRLIGLFLGTEPTLPELDELDSWGVTNSRLTLARELLWNGQTELRRTLFLSRVPIIFAGLLLGAALFRWTRHSLVVGTLWAFSPNWLAHSSLASTDAVLVVAFALAVTAVRRYRQRPSGSRLFGAGIALGLALAAKTSGLIMLPISAILLLPSWTPSRGWWIAFKRWLPLLPLAALTVWLIYGFEWRPLSNFPLTLPAATYIDNILNVQTHLQSGHVAYLFGERSTEGWYHYFLVAFLVKTPLPTLLLVAAALLTVFARRSWWEHRDYWLPPLLMFLVAAYTRLNIGYRHMLPTVPYLWLFIDTAFRSWRSTFLRRGAFLLLLWIAVSSLLQAPDYLSFFNIAARGSAQEILGNSNIDWGQDLWSLLDYEASSQEPLKISYGGFADPAYYELDTIDIDPESGLADGFASANPQAGHYAISIGHLQGFLVEPDTFDWFRDKTPAKKLGGSILVYQVRDPLSGGWIAHCDRPQPAISSQQAERLVGQDGLRHLFFDCTQSFVFPVGGPGWYLLPSANAINWLPAQLAEGLEVVYNHHATTSAPDYVVVYASAPPDPGANAGAWISAIARTWTGAVRLENGEAENLPISVGESAQLLGYKHEPPTWLTLWHVTGSPSQFLSLSAHLYDDTEIPLEVADGLGLPSIQWQPGDHLMQRHSFETAVSCENGTMAAGLYDYATGDHLPVPGGTQLLLKACP